MVDHAPIAADRVLETVYDELRAIASRYMQSCPEQCLLQPTALVHEAYLKLFSSMSLDDLTRSHYRAVTARAMRHVLIDHLRSDGRAKHGGDRKRVSLHGADEAVIPTAVDAERFESAMQSLAKVDDRAAQVVTMRFYGGLSVEEIATLLGVTARTVNNDWRAARAWLRLHMED